MSEITHEISLQNFQEQFEYVFQNYTKHNRKIADYSNIVIGGLGGSGIGGRIAKSYFFQEMPVPVEVFSDYHLPAYANENTLTILCSYSGNTEETLNMLAEAQEKECSIICMAAGGKLMELANDNNYPTYTIAEGYQPRMTLGFALANLLMILGELIDKDMEPELRTVQNMFVDPVNAMLRAEEMRQAFEGNLHQSFLIVADAAYEAVAIRVCQQIQENAKGEAFISVLPEANHNMIESYYDKRDHNIILMNSGNNARVNARFDFLEKLLVEKGNSVYKYPINDATLISLFEVIHATDWLSIWASDEKKVNNMEVGIIMELKGFLASHT